MQVTLGGERLGSGNKNKISMRNYERSTHDLGYIWRSTMSAGTLVPFMSELALPGDTFDIHLNVDVLTHPTIGPLFGEYKVQLDVFQIPVRLYQSELHMNMLGIGRDMSKVLLPQLKLTAAPLKALLDLDNQQINPSCIFSYLNMRGLGAKSGAELSEVTRNFNAIPYLGYWDIYKNYYANKQEGIGAVIHQDTSPTIFVITAASLFSLAGGADTALDITPPNSYVEADVIDTTYILLTMNEANNLLSPQQVRVQMQWGPYEDVFSGDQLFKDWQYNEVSKVYQGNTPTPLAKGLKNWGLVTYEQMNPNIPTIPKIYNFDLDQIDQMRLNILRYYNVGVPFDVGAQGLEPYSLPMDSEGSGELYVSSMQYSQEGLALKTYNSDLFNNWINTDWIDGVDGVSAVTAVSTVGDSFTIDELNLSKKIYDMLNRIALSGGSYDDWLDAVYTEKRQRSAENPMYLGGLIKSLVFQEVVSNAASIDQPLGTLAGRGRIGGKHKGGKIIAKVDEPSYIMGIISLTPKLDYSQGNKWDVNLKTMNDFHKPALDEIGFQDLITDQMTFWDTMTDANGDPIFKSAGKQPAWINYMTNVNQVRGNFAEQAQQMFMVLNRRYEPEYDGGGGVFTIRDLTTYIDPSKFNHIFANTAIDAQNFWVQIAVDITARRKMSAKVIPNL